MDPYYAPSYGNRAILLYQTNDLKGALADLNEAIRLNTRESWILATALLTSIWRSSGLNSRPLS